MQNVPSLGEYLPSKEDMAILDKLKSNHPKVYEDARASWFASCQAQTNAREAITHGAKEDQYARRRGQRNGLILGLVAFIGGGYLVNEGKDLWSIVVLIGAIAALVGIQAYAMSKLNRPQSENEVYLIADDVNHVGTSNGEPPRLPEGLPH